MNDYLIEAVRVLQDPDQTRCAKEVAEQILRNAGYSSQDIDRAVNSSSGRVKVRVTVFLA